MSFNNTQQLKVLLKFAPQQEIFVGRLLLDSRTIWFEYSPEFLQSGLDISPFKLQLRPGAQTCNEKFQDGLFGVFYDCLPDGWGRLLLDRYLLNHKIHPNSITALDRLSFVGSSGMGALCFEPEHKDNIELATVDLHQLAQASHAILQGHASKYVDELLKMNGASAGVRPKILIGLSDDKQEIIGDQANLPQNYSPWLLKFPALHDLTEIGKVEFVYNQMAKAANLKVNEFCLLESSTGQQYFASKRFDRNHNNRLHMQTFAGLLHVDFRIPALDYNLLLKVTALLTKDQQQVEMAYRLAVFNIFAHNRDDHGKNFAFLMHSDGAWHLAPAYDLTFSSGPGNEHSTTVMGEGKNPGITQLNALAKEHAVTEHETIIQEVRDAIALWNNYAQEAGVEKETIAMIAKSLNRE